MVVLGSTAPTLQGCLIRVANGVGSEPDLSQGCQSPVLSLGDVFLTEALCAPLVFSEGIGASGWHVLVATSPGAPGVGMASALTLRVKRKVPDFPGATVRDLFCCKMTTKNLQGPSPREYQPGASSAAGASSTPASS